MNRRSFFQSLARAAAIVALAPQLAFRVRPERLLVSEYVPVLEFKANAMGVYAQLQAYGAVLDANWEHVRNNWMKPENVKWLEAQPQNQQQPESNK